MNRPSVILLLFLFPFVGFAQKAKFEFYNTANGLEGNNTTSVTQDDQGFVWFVNEGRIHRYDGYNFLVYPSPPGLPDAPALLGLASWQDSLLFVWSEHLSFLFNPKSGQWQSINRKDDKTQSSDINYWQRLGQNSILINSVKKGYKEATIWHFQNGQLEPVHFSNRRAKLIETFYWCDIDDSGITYLAYRDTLFQLDKSGKTLVSTPLDNICRDCYNLCFQFGPNKELILLANWRFYRLDREQNKFFPHPANRFLQARRNHLHRFILEKDGSIWACGQDRNLIYYDAEEDTLYNYHDELKVLLPNPNDFKGLFQDKTGVIWIDTRLGLLKVRPQTYPFDNYFNGINQFNAYYSFRGFSEDKRGMIYGVFYDGIASFDPAKKQPQRLHPFKNALNLFDLYAEGDQLWVNGGQLFDPKTGTLKNFPSLFFKMVVGDNGFFAKEENGTLWWATHYFLYYLDRSDGSLQWKKELELPEKIFNKTEALHAGRKSEKLWISFKGKLLQYDPKTKVQRWFDPKDWSLPVSRIPVVEEDRDGKLWLGTDAGLVHADPVANTAKRYTINEGLPNNFICGLLSEGDTCLWLSTNHGLSRFHIPTSTFINFFEEDGLTSNEFNRMSFYKARNGRMFFGGMRGVNAFFPDAVMRAFINKEKAAQMVFTAFEYTDERRDTIIRETKFPVNPELKLHYWDWSYTFEYALTDFNNTQEVFYSWKMEGYKDSWSAPSKFNFTRFNSLPAGDYVFRVKARDGQGRLSPNELAVKVIVLPPWWATWWAYLTYFMLLSGLAYVIYSFLKKRLLLQNQLKLEHEESARLKELDRFKSRLYTNLTHEFRTPLTVILGMVGQLKAEPGKYLEEGTRLIEANGKSLLRLINQLLDLSKLENKSFQLNLQQSDIVPYLRYVTESFQTYANSRNLSLRFFSTLESLVIDFDPEQIQQVLANLISNAVKFTPSGGALTIRLSQQQDRLLISLKDTGIGISEKNLPHIFDRFYQVDGSHTRAGEGTGIGLAHSQELVKIMGGEISVISEIGKGSTFTVRLPITNNAVMADVSPQDQTEPFSNPEYLESKSEKQVAVDSSVPDVPANLPQLLIIEDNPDVVVYLKTCLESLYQLDVAYNGKIGIEKALESIPDLIISDVMMPEKDGYQVCDTLKNDDRTSHIPIVLLTAKADTASRIKGLRRGADAYLSKPFDKEELLVRLEKLVERQKRMVAHFSKNLLSEMTTGEDEIKQEESIQVEDAFMQRIRQIIEDNYANEDFSLPQLCQKIGMSRSQLFRKMQALIDISPSDFIRSYRLSKARILLETTDLNVSEAAWQVGFKDPGHFSKLFQEEFGFLPSATSK